TPSNRGRSLRRHARQSAHEACRAPPSQPLPGGRSMTTRSRPTRYRVLEAVAEDVLLAVHQHRLLTTSQLHTLMFPDRTVRRTQAMLAELARLGLVAAVAARRSTPGPAESVWFLTRRGADVVQAPDNAEPRRRP